MSIFSIGVSGLNAAQIALATTGNNITNVYTPGYNREVTLLAENSSSNGVGVSGVQRQFNQFISTQLNQAISSNSALSAYEVQINQIDNLLADRDAGLAPLMQNFFSALQKLVATPSDPAARQGVLGTADTLTAQFRAFDSYLNDMQSGINGQIESQVVQVNNMAEQIAKLNREIGLAKAKTGAEPNSLLNQRDQLVADLSRYVDVKVVQQDGGSYNVSIGNGLSLVAGSSSFKLQAMPSTSDPGRTVVGYKDVNGNLLQLREESFKGGELGGLMAFRRETLDRAQNQLGQMAVAMAIGFNQQHRQGVDLNGELGGDFFSVGQPQVFGNDKNTSAAYLTAEFDPAQIDKLNIADYDVLVKDANDLSAGLQITRRDTGEVVSYGYDTATGKISFGGIEVSVNGAPVADGDRFQIQPVRRAARDLRSEIADVGRLAAGSIAQISAKSSNAGTASLKVSFDPATPPTFNNYEVSYSGGSYAVKLTSGVVVAATTGTDAQGKTTLSFGDITLTVDGVPKDGDSFTVKMPGGPGDNRNAVALLELQNAKLVNGSAGLTQAYASMVSDVGNRTNIIQVNQDAQEGLVKQLKAVQQSDSGVSLDEEGANLLRFQRYYQASAKVIEVGTTVIDTLLSMRS